MVLALAGHATLARAQSQAAPALSTPGSSIWESGLGEGFKKGTQELGLSVGPGFGMKVLGSRRSHDWVLGTLDYGWMFRPVVGEGRWYRGNWELVGELFGGKQYRPDSGYVAGLTPLLRYNFATGHRLMPFVNLGAGVTATDIRNGDLSTTFEFNLQGGAGVRFFLRDDLALSVQYRFIHLSNANLDTPNLGLNSSTVLGGVSWFF